MGIFGAMTTAVSGLTAQSFALESISGNIANSRTVGFRRVDTSFSAMIGDLPNGQGTAGSVAAYGRSTADEQGDRVSSGSGTHIAISGGGFFSVQQQSGATAGSGQPLFTRRGDFDLNADGFLVNGAGHILKGYPVDQSTGSGSAAALQPLKISNDVLPARATTLVEYSGNLPRWPDTARSDRTVPNSELLTGAAFSGPTVLASDEAGFLDRTIPGQSVTVFDQLGTPVSVQMRWGKTANTVPETWSLYYLSDGQAVGAQTRWTRMADNIQFDSNGRQTQPAGNSLSISFTVDGTTAGPMTFQFGTSGLTQYDATSGQMQAGGLNQNGYSLGTRLGLAFEEGGRLVARYSNGQVQELARVPVMMFPSSSGLRRVDGGAFEQTLESGQPVSMDAGRMISGGTLEMANVDIADEFSKMIVTQQAYSANTRVITTAQQMIQDAMNIVR